MTYRAFYSLTRSEAIRISLGFAAFLIYAAATLFSIQPIPLRLDNGLTTAGSWLIERAGMASAISNIVYGAPVGTVYSNLLNTFLYSETPLEELIPKAVHKQIPLGELMPFVPDGIGIGQAVFTTVAMRVFGIHPQSILLLFLILMGIVTLAFLSRFHDQRSVVILLVFLALTLLFVSPWARSENLSQVAPGGHRYFSLLAVIPCLHIFLELIDTKRKSLFTRGHAGLLVLQLLVFMIVYFMSAASIYAFGPLVLAAIYVFIATRGTSEKTEILLSKILIIAGVMGSSLFAFVILTPRAYAVTGRAQAATTWHHVIIGFGANPNWPFGNLADVYRGCMPDKPNDSLVPGLTDFNGGCVWGDYAKRHAISLNQMGAELYDKNFDAATKRAVFRIIRAYPLQSLLTFVYYKPLLIWDTLMQYLAFTPAILPIGILIICQIVVFLAFTVLNRSLLSVSALKQVYSGFALAAISTIGLYIVAYSTLNTSIDLFFYVLVLISTLAATIVAAVFQMLWPSAEVPSGMWLEFGSARSPVT